MRLGSQSLDCLCHITELLQGESKFTMAMHFICEGRVAALAELLTMLYSSAFEFWYQEEHYAQQLQLVYPNNKYLEGIS